MQSFSFVFLPGILFDVKIPHQSNLTSVSAERIYCALCCGETLDGSRPLGFRFE